MLSSKIIYICVCNIYIYVYTHILPPIYMFYIIDFVQYPQQHNVIGIVISILYIL